MAFLADDDVIVHRDSEWPRNIDDRLRHLDIGMVEASLASQKRTKGRCWRIPGDDAVAEFIRSGFRAMPQIFVKEFIQFGI